MIMSTYIYVDMLEKNQVKSLRMAKESASELQQRIELIELEPEGFDGEIELEYNEDVILFLDDVGRDEFWIAVDRGTKYSMY